MARQVKAPRPAEAVNAGDIVQPTIPNRLEFRGTTGARLIVESGDERLAEVTKEHESDQALMARLVRALELGLLEKV